MISAAPSDEGDYRVIVTAPETAHYTAAESTAYFRILGQQETELSVKVESKTYDGKPGLKIVGTPVSLEFHEGDNPYENKKNRLTQSQIRAKRRLMKFVMSKKRKAAKKG